MSIIWSIYPTCGVIYFVLPRFRGRFVVSLVLLGESGNLALQVQSIMRIKMRILSVLVRLTTVGLALATMTLASKPAQAHWDHDVLATNLVTQLRPNTVGSTTTALGQAAGLLWTNCPGPGGSYLYAIMYVDGVERSSHVLPAPYSASGQDDAVVFTDNTEVALTPGTHQVEYFGWGLPWSSVFDWPHLWDHQETMIVP